MCDPNSEAQASPMLLPGAPPSQPPIAGGGHDRPRQPGRAAEQADPESERLGAHRPRHLVDEAFGGEGDHRLLAAAHIAGADRQAGVDRVDPDRRDAIRRRGASRAEARDGLSAGPRQDASSPGMPAIRALQAAIGPSGEGSAARRASIGGRTASWFCAVAGGKAQADRPAGMLRQLDGDRDAPPGPSPLPDPSPTGIG